MKALNGLDSQVREYSMMRTVSPTSSRSSGLMLRVTCSSFVSIGLNRMVFGSLTTVRTALPSKSSRLGLRRRFRDLMSCLFHTDAAQDLAWDKYSAEPGTMSSKCSILRRGMHRTWHSYLIWRRVRGGRPTQRSS